MVPSDLAALEEGWDTAAREDALGNILTVPGLTEREFWRRGRDTIDELVAHLNDVTFGRALDFGCGVGRLTQALARHFDWVDGVDVSSEMVRLAERHSWLPHRIRFHWNPVDDLRLFPDASFDLVYSVIVLQHMPSRLAEGYVREFVRVTKRGGLLAFQMPEGRDAPFRADAGWLSMFATSRETVEGWLDGTTVLEVRQNDAAGPSMVSNEFLARRL